ncbi:hypothetical protein ElyMa_001902300 [Elysia marginata]|uniref:Uncharacterized protein n=1 Tax=Elysia marginata TaxID=1093978 RepID=A0AAV4ESH9_9GAST|nr:hypothetical protein ElyMa_001902300 [Elysia marginata]
MKKLLHSRPSRDIRLQLVSSPASIARPGTASPVLPSRSMRRLLRPGVSTEPSDKAQAQITILEDNIKSLPNSQPPLESSPAR